MIAEDFIQAMAPYKNPQGFVTLKPNQDQPDDNAHLFSATYLAVLANCFGWIDHGFEISYWLFASNCRTLPGLFDRSPTNISRLISHDEQIGICSASIMYAVEIVKRGIRSKWFWKNWFYDNVDGTRQLSTWHYRFGIAVPYYKHMGVGKLGPNIIDQLCWSLNTVIASFQPKGDTSGRCLIYLMSINVRHGRWLMRQACKFFLWKLWRDYGDLSGLYTIYYGSDHPLSQHTKGIRT